MSDDTKVSGTVQVEQEGRHAIAYKLMQMIGNHEYDAKSREQVSREYWLQLFVECVDATNGYLPDRMRNRGG